VSGPNKRLRILVYTHSTPLARPDNGRRNYHGRGLPHVPESVAGGRGVVVRNQSLLVHCNGITVQWGTIQFQQ
jgi:hypothetical protein